MTFGAPEVTKGSPGRSLGGSGGSPEQEGQGSVVTDPRLGVPMEAFGGPQEASGMPRGPPGIQNGARELQIGAGYLTETTQIFNRNDVLILDWFLLNFWVVSVKFLGPGFPIGLFSAYVLHFSAKTRFWLGG